MAEVDSRSRVIETLRQEGFIDGIRAQLRAQVVKTLEAEKKAQLGSAAKYIKPLSLSTTRKVISNEDGLLCAELIREFLTFYKMDHTLSVFVPEMSLHPDFKKSRDEMSRECGVMKSQDDQSKPLILTMVEKVRVGDYGAGAIRHEAPSSAGKKGSNLTEDYSESPGAMQPHFTNENIPDQTPPTTGIQGSGGDNGNSRKNTMNHKQKQHKSKKGAPVEDSNSSNKKNALTSLGDLPGFGSKFQQPDAQENDNDYDFKGFDDFGEDENSNSQGQDNNQSRYSNAEKYLDDFENEQKEGFKVEVTRPGKKKKAAPTSSGNKRNKFGLSDNFGHDEEDELIEEDIMTDRDKDNLGENIQTSVGYGAGITVSQSLGIDPSVDSLALDEYDHIEVVEI